MFMPPISFIALLAFRLQRTFARRSIELVIYATMAKRAHLFYHTPR